MGRRFVLVLGLVVGLVIAKVNTSVDDAAEFLTAINSVHQQLGAAGNLFGQVINPALAAQQVSVSSARSVRDAMIAGLQQIEKIAATIRVPRSPGAAALAMAQRRGIARKIQHVMTATAEILRLLEDMTLPPFDRALRIRDAINRLNDLEMIDGVEVVDAQRAFCVSNGQTFLYPRGGQSAYLARVVLAHNRLLQVPARDLGLAIKAAMSDGAVDTTRFTASSTALAATLATAVAAISRLRWPDTPTGRSFCDAEKQFLQAQTRILHVEVAAMIRVATDSALAPDVRASRLRKHIASASTIEKQVAENLLVLANALIYEESSGST
jgi:hypothetical protein